MLTELCCVRDPTFRISVIWGNIKFIVRAATGPYSPGGGSQINIFLALRTVDPGGGEPSAVDHEDFSGGGTTPEETREETD